MTKLELLAPARDARVAREAIMHGADAIYIGGPAHGARAAAANSVVDIAATAELAHSYGARVYATVNTIIYDNELARAEQVIRELYRAGVDALIVQDMAVLRLDIPPIALHASTQCDIRTVEKAQFLAKCGFSQLVLPRELSAAEIREMRQALPADVALEAFVHGALCVSYSGDCQASFAANGRSANRGECAQMCRMAYDLVDGAGNVLARDKHLLSLRDLNRLADIPEMALAGISSFKIEGRLKDASYVKNVVGAYRRAIDAFIAERPGEFCRSSWGESVLSFHPDVDNAFNRGFTSYFFNWPQASKMASLDTPKWIGRQVGVAQKAGPRCIEAKLSAEVSNGDGLGFFDASGKFSGFRVNRVEGGRLYTAQPVAVPAGAALYRNNDIKLETALAKETAERTIAIGMALRLAPAGILSLSICAPEICGGAEIATAAIECAVDAARSPQTEARRRVLGKLGDTIYRLAELDDQLDPMAFVPASTLAELRRRAVAALQSTLRATYRYECRRAEDATALYPAKALTYHDNVANRLAAEFYRSHGVEQIEKAMEVGGGKGEARVMTTRYCLRRELGACLRDRQGKKLPAPLYIQNRAARFRLDFDCSRCQMMVVKED